MLRTDTAVTCEPCDDSCKTCEESALKCLDCDPD